MVWVCVWWLGEEVLLSEEEEEELEEGEVVEDVESEQAAKAGGFVPRAEISVMVV